MSKKNILTEHTVRRFMTLASIGTPNSKFIKENFVTEEEEEPIDDEPMDDEPMDDEPMDDEPIGDEPEAEEPLDAPPEGDGDMELSDEEASVLVALGKKLEAAGVDAAGEEPEPDMEAPEEEPPGPEGPEDPEAEAPPEEEPEEMLEDIDVVSEDEFGNMVNEIMKRVTKRLVRERLKR